jgi:hypothetical protein
VALANGVMAWVASLDMGKPLTVFLVLGLAACATTSELYGTEEWAQERYKSAVAGCNTVHSYDQSVAFSAGQSNAAADAKYQACLAKAEANQKQDMDVVHGVAK